MICYLAFRSSFHLGILQVRSLRGGWVYEPGVDKMSSVGRILGGSSQNPCQRIVEDGVGHGLEIARIVNEEAIRVEHAITIDIRTLSPD